MEFKLKSLGFSILITTFICLSILVGHISAEALRLPDQQGPVQQVQQPQLQLQPQQQQQQQPINLNNVQTIFPNQQQQPQQLQQPGVGGEERGRSSILDIFGLGSDNDPYLARTSSNCLSGDLSECFKNQALSTFDEIFYRQSYPLTEFARVVRMPENQQRSLLQEPFEYSEEPRNEDNDWDQMAKYALRRAERFIKSTALEVEVPEEFTEAGRYQARFIGNDIDSELDIIEDKHASGLKRKKLKKLIIPLLLVLKIFKLKLLLFLPFILGLVGLKKILSLAAIILPGVFAYFKLCRPPGAGFSSGGGILSGLFGAKESFTQYSPQGVGSATYYHHHDHYEHGGYRPEPQFSKPYGDYYNKNYDQGTATSGNSVSFGGSHEAAYSGYYGRNTGKDIESTQKS